MVKISEKLHLVPVFFIHIAETQKEQQKRTDNFETKKFVFKIGVHTHKINK